MRAAPKNLRRAPRACHVLAAELVPAAMQQSELEEVERQAKTLKASESVGPAVWNFSAATLTR